MRVKKTTASSNDREYYESSSNKDFYEGSPRLARGGKGKESIYQSPRIAAANKGKESYYNGKTESVQLQKDKNKVRGYDYRKDYLRTQDERGNLNAPVLGPDGIPINAATGNVSNLVLLKRHYNSVERLMETRIYRERADEPTKKVIIDIRNILADLILMVETRKTDEQFGRLFKDMKLFSTDLSNDSELKILLEDWKTTLIKLVTGDESKGILRSTSKVLTDLKGSETIFKFFSETSKFLNMIVLDKNNSMIDEQREIVFDNFFKAFRILSANPAWNEFVLRSKTLGKEVKETKNIESKNAESKINSIKSNRNFNSLNDNFKILLQSFIKDKSVANVDNLYQYGSETMTELEKNKDYASFLEDFQNLTLEIMENPELVDDPAFRKAIRDMYAKAEKLAVDTKQNPSLQRFVNEASRLKDGIATDEINSRLFEHVKQLSSDLNTHSSQGNIRLFGQLKMLLVPFLLEEFRTISIPPRSGLTPDRNLGYRIGNINLSAIELLPENIHFEISHKTNADPYTLSIIDPDTVVWVELTAIRARIEKLDWEYTKFNFPRLKDKGLADIYLDGRGARVGVEIRLLKDGLQRKTQVLDSYCIIDNLSIKLYNCKHTIIYSLFTRLLKKRLKFEVEKAIAQQVAKIIAETDYKMVGKYHVAKQNRLKMKSKVNSRLAEFRSKMKKNTKKAQKDKPNPLSNFYNTFMGKDDGSSSTRKSTTINSPTLLSTKPLPIPANTSTTTTTTTTTMAVPLTTVPLENLPLATESVQYVANPTTANTTYIKEEVKKEMFVNPQESHGPSYVGPSSK
ncbi:hypothetical protein CYY_002147 [Polysphondylium violaceum]|uniref:HAM1-like N-terminal domain-containing protein n=1 Tax=Polysphondylium violaceum TaxID=133409 RepID=A0A8J4PX83_9MYCE|nr:hypothetical protein CYY_002147 [Polysphondylium violaceum]